MLTTLYNSFFVTHYFISRKQINLNNIKQKRRLTHLNLIGYCRISLLLGFSEKSTPFQEMIRTLVDKKNIYHFREFNISRHQAEDYPGGLLK